MLQNVIVITNIETLVYNVRTNLQGEQKGSIIMFNFYNDTDDAGFSLLQDSGDIETNSFPFFGAEGNIFRSYLAATEEEHIIDDDGVCALCGGNHSIDDGHGHSHAQKDLFTDVLAPQDDMVVNMDTIPDNNTTTETISINGSATGTIEDGNDRDFFRVDLVAGQTYEFYMVRGGDNPMRDPFLYLYDTDGTTILTQNDDIQNALGQAASQNSKIVFTATESGTYFLGADRWDPASGINTSVGAGDYVLYANEEGFRPEATLDEAAYFLTDQFSNRTYWDQTTITYDISALPEAVQILAIAAMQQWADVTPITFVAAAAGETANLNFTDDEDGAFAATRTLNGIITEATINVSNEQWVGTHGTDVNSYTYTTYIHEVGHALGLGHAGPYNGNATYGIDNVFSNDFTSFSIMSYNDQIANSPIFAATPRLALSLQIVDIIAIQELYGANEGGTRDGSTTYGFNSNAGGVFDFSTFFAAGIRPPAISIYDTGGHDILDLSGYSADQRISLLPETFSDIGNNTNLGGDVALLNVLSIARDTFIEEARGGSGNDDITGNDGANTIFGNAGNDTVSGGLGNDILLGNDGNDTVIGDDGNDVLYGNNGADTLQGGAGDDILLGGAGDDLLEGGDGNDRFTGGTGNDTFNGGAGDDGFLTEDGDDIVNAGDGNDTVFGSGGNDTISGNAGEDVLLGGIGNDSIFGGEGNDSITAGEGNDVVEGGNGNDGILGQDGNDILSGNAGDDILIAHAGSDQVFGGDGDDIILGGIGEDELFGGADDDLLNGQDGNDTISGDSGNDLIGGEAGDDFIDGGTGNDNLFGQLGDDTINGGDGDDGVYGGDGDDILNGQAGTDLIAGANGNDTLSGGAGNDLLAGQSGNDTLMGGAGVDSLFGGTGINILTGGSGNDFFSIGGEGSDTITDLAAGDLIIIKVAGLNSLADVQGASTQIGANLSIDLGNGQTLTINNMTADALSASAFSFQNGGTSQQPKSDSFEFKSVDRTDTNNNDQLSLDDGFGSSDGFIEISDTLFDHVIDAPDVIGEDISVYDLDALI